MKKIVSALAAVMIAASPAAIAGNGIDFYLNDEHIDCIAHGDNIGNICLSTRSFFEAAGYTVQWFSDAKQVTVFCADTNITMFADGEYVYVNDVPYSAADEMSLDGGVSVIPLTLAAQLLDAEIQVSGNDIYFYTDMAEDSSGWQYDILTLVNNERAERGLSPLIWNSGLAAAAYDHCSDMIRRNYFAHIAPDGQQPSDRLRSFDIYFLGCAENIAAGQPDPDTVMTAWMNSPGHRANILDPNMDEMGAAFVRGGTYGIYWAQEFANTK